MSFMKSGVIVAQGKTKTIHGVDGTRSMVILENRDEITKNDDPSQTVSLASKSKLATITSCGVFEAMRTAGLPVAYLEQNAPKEILATRCSMIPLEVVIRRFGTGSYLKRHGLPKPKIWWDNMLVPLVFEIFLKTSGGNVRDFCDFPLAVTPADPDTGRPIDDPLVENPRQSVWRLMHPKLPPGNPNADLGVDVLSERFVPYETSMREIEAVARMAFLFLENAWEQFMYRMIDLKLEFGIDPAGSLVIADVVDNDNWRMVDDQGKEVSKQLFRDNAPMEDIREAYERVAVMSTRLVSVATASSRRARLRFNAESKLD